MALRRIYLTVAVLAAVSFLCCLLSLARGVPPRPIVRDPTADVSPASLLWLSNFRADRALVTASSELPVAGERLRLFLPTKQKSVSGYWRLLAPECRVLLTDTQQRKGLPSSLPVVEVFASQWGETISQQSGHKESDDDVTVSVALALPNDARLTGERLTCIVSGTLEKPEYAGQGEWKPVGGAPDLFRVSTAPYEQSFDLTVFAADRRQALDRWTAAMRLSHYGLPLLVVVGYLGARRCGRRWDNTPAQWLLGIATALVAFATVAVCALMSKIA